MLKTLAQTFMAATLALPLALGQKAEADPLSDSTISQMLSTRFGVVDPPACKKGWRSTQYVPATGAFLRRSGTQLAMAMKGEWGQPLIYADFDFMAHLPPLFQSFVIAHECAHIQSGHIDNASPTPEQRRNYEDRADCTAIVKMKRKMGLTQIGLNQIRDYNQAVGQVIDMPQQDIDHRNAVIQSCYNRY